MKKIHQISFFLLVLTTACSESSSLEEMSPEKRLITKIENKNWQFEAESCNSNSFQFVFHDLNSFDLVYENPISVNGESQNIFTYSIIYIEENTIYCQWDEEYRFISNSNLIDWNIVLEDENTLYWKLTNTSVKLGPIIICN
jgi:hypothetical protein